MSLVEAPARRKPSAEEVEALIEEARRRARRRRLVAAAAVAAVAAAAGVAAAVLLTAGGESTTAAAPEGFHFVHAEGPVVHATITEYPLLRQRVVDVETGRERPAPLRLEVWWDPKSGFDRVVGRVDGRVQFDVVGQTCQGAAGMRGRFCLPPPPFDLRKMHYRLPIDSTAVREVGSGTYRGHRVVWLAAVINGQPNPFERVAIDVATRRPVGKRTFVRGRLFYEETYTFLDELPRKKVTFVVPDRGTPRRSFPPFPSVRSHFQRTDLRRARAALGIVPLWLGRRFGGHALRSVAIGSEDAVAPNGGSLTRARFVRFDYGIVAFREFGRVRPLGFVSAPRRGRVVIGSNVLLGRAGLLVMAEFPARALPIERAAALAFARALRPVPTASAPAASAPRTHR